MSKLNLKSAYKNKIPRWAIVGGLFLFLLIVTAISVIWFKTGDVWQEQPALLRVLNGSVQVYDKHDGKPVDLKNQVWLHAGNCIVVAENSSAIIQYFDKSAVTIEGPAEVHHDWSQRPKGTPKPEMRAIGLEILSGDITIAATRQPGSRSLFTIRSSDSIGVTRGALLRVVASAGKPTTWQVNQNAAKVGAITAGNDLQPVISVVRLNTGEGLIVPDLPSQWQSDGQLLPQLKEIARAIVEKSEEQNRMNIDVEGANLLAANEDTQTAVFKFTSGKNIFGGISSETMISQDYKKIENTLLKQFAPWLINVRLNSIQMIPLPVLPVPDGWEVSAAETAIDRKSPPAYLFSILNIGKPIGIGVDSIDQRIYVTESDFERVTQVFDFKGNKLTDLAPPGTSPSNRAPMYVAVNPLYGTVYISDRSRNTIDVYDSLGGYLGQFEPTKESGLARWSPLGLNTDTKGNLYVTEVTDEKHRVLVFDPAGNLKMQIGREGKDDGEFSFPNDIAVDKSGKIYVADSNNYRIQVFVPEGNLQDAFTRDIGKTVGFARGIRIEGHYIYVVDTFSHMVNVYDIDPQAKKKLVYSFGQRGIGDGEFNFPNGLAIDFASRLYIADRENNRIQIWGY